ncbi:hypothetical protein KPH14_010647 [Odynerus spinipes]|uniref:Uncharacterized protein n=1 Tax=Odynerus spinipes TaxID=1348599 RepID=A0AAD9RW64_9HYME|nr:hypothetical protein KPH14_010647 [Odynerus spinipes]
MTSIRFISEKVLIFKVTRILRGFGLDKKSDVRARRSILREDSATSSEGPCERSFPGLPPPPPPPPPTPPSTPPPPPQTRHVALLEARLYFHRGPWNAEGDGVVGECVRKPSRL